MSMTGHEDLVGRLVKTGTEFTHPASSHYALQVSVQTLKERCQRLQQRILDIEDENLNLQIENKKVSPNLMKSKEEEKYVNALEERIAQLTSQKSQLTHHIYMVAAENKQLWTRLSKLTEANHSLGSHVTKISETLNKHHLEESLKPNQSIQIMNSCEREFDNEEKDESLEEISLKIISGIIREKIELEQQCDQMSALQAGTLSVEDCDFTTLRADATDTEEVGQDLRKVLENLREQKEQLMKQQAGLRDTLVTFTTAIKNGTLPCKKCQSREKVANVPMNESQNQPQKATVDPEDNRVTSDGAEFENFEEDRICPLCSQFFPRSARFEDFHSHVLTHFSDEDGDISSLVTNNYEIVN